ncbi:MAG: M15 family metallopeptidase [Actinomycetota bacterium]
MRKLVLIVTALALASTGCGATARDDLPLGPPDAQQMQLPDPLPAIPAYTARVSRPVDDSVTRRLERSAAIAVVAPISLKELRVSGPVASRVVRVGVVDALKYRTMAPPSTRDAEFVWTSLLAGKAVVTFDAAQKLKLKEDSTISLPESGPIEIGAFADNGSPNLVDILLDKATANVTAPRLLVVAASSTDRVGQARRVLERVLPRARLRRLSLPSDAAIPQTTGYTQTTTVAGMSFRILEGGYISPDPGWVASNITTISVPILGSFPCHRIMSTPLTAALSEIQEGGLAGLIRPGDFAGCYSPRFIDRDPGKPLSMHAFGLAVDINVSTNQLGTRGDMDPRIVQIFTKWGFEWGGYWSRPDPMHFELDRIVQP